MESADSVQAPSDLEFRVRDEQGLSHPMPETWLRSAARSSYVSMSPRPRLWNRNDWNFEPTPAFVELYMDLRQSCSRAPSGKTLKCDHCTKKMKHRLTKSVSTYCTCEGRQVVIRARKDVILCSYEVALSIIFQLDEIVSAVITILMSILELWTMF